MFKVSQYLLKCFHRINDIFLYEKQFAILSLVIAYTNAGSLGRSYGGFGAGLALSTGAGYAAPALPVRALPTGPVNAAIQSTRTVEFIPLALPQDAVAPQVIDVEPYEQPVQITFRSATSPLLIQQVHHRGAPAHHEATRSEEEASHLLHEVYKPVIQEFREIIQPFRKITQEVKPVLEEVRTVVAKGEGYRTAPLAAPVFKAEPLLRETPILVKKPY